MDIFKAIRDGNFEQIKDCLKNEIDVNKQDESKVTPLNLACIRGDFETSKLLLEYYGADPDIENYEGNTALIHATAFGHMKIVKLLIKHGANVEIANRNNSSVLEYVFGIPRIINIKLVLHKYLHLFGSDKREKLLRQKYRCRLGK